MRYSHQHMAAVAGQPLANIRAQDAGNGRGQRLLEQSQVSRLRQKLDTATGEMVRTVRNEGYVLAAPVIFE